MSSVVVDKHLFRYVDTTEDMNSLNIAYHGDCCIATVTGEINESLVDDISRNPSVTRIEIHSASSRVAINMRNLRDLIEIADVKIVCDTLEIDFQAFSFLRIYIETNNAFQLDLSEVREIVPQVFQDDWEEAKQCFILNPNNDVGAFMRWSRLLFGQQAPFDVCDVNGRIKKYKTDDGVLVLVEVPSISRYAMDLTIYLSEEDKKGKLRVYFYIPYAELKDLQEMKVISNHTIHIEECAIIAGAAIKQDGKQKRLISFTLEGTVSINHLNAVSVYELHMNLKCEGKINEITGNCLNKIEITCFKEPNSVVIGSVGSSYKHLQTVNVALAGKGASYRTVFAYELVILTGAVCIDRAKVVIMSGTLTSNHANLFVRELDVVEFIDEATLHQCIGLERLRIQQVRADIDFRGMKLICLEVNTDGISQAFNEYLFSLSNVNCKKFILRTAYGVVFCGMYQNIHAEKCVLKGHFDLVDLSGTGLETSQIVLEGKIRLSNMAEYVQGAMDSMDDKKAASKFVLPRVSPSAFSKEGGLGDDSTLLNQYRLMGCRIDNHKLIEIGAGVTMLEVPSSIGTIELTSNAPSVKKITISPHQLNALTQAIEDFSELGHVKIKDGGMEEIGDIQALLNQIEQTENKVRVVEIAYPAVIDDGIVRHAKRLKLTLKLHNKVKANCIQQVDPACIELVGDWSDIDRHMLGEMTNTIGDLRIQTDDEFCNIYLFKPKVYDLRERIQNMDSMGESLQEVFGKKIRVYIGARHNDSPVMATAVIEGVDVIDELIVLPGANINELRVNGCRRIKKLGVYGNLCVIKSYDGNYFNTSEKVKIDCVHIAKKRSNILFERIDIGSLVTEKTIYLGLKDVMVDEVVNAGDVCLKGKDTYIKLIKSAKRISAINLSYGRIDKVIDSPEIKGEFMSDALHIGIIENNKANELSVKTATVGTIMAKWCFGLELSEVNVEKATVNYIPKIFGEKNSLLNDCIYGCVIGELTLTGFACVVYKNAINPNCRINNIKSDLYVCVNEGQKWIDENHIVKEDWIKSSIIDGEV